jgi:hypothetical protein
MLTENTTWELYRWPVDQPPPCSPRIRVITPRNKGPPNRHHTLVCRSKGPYHDSSALAGGVETRSLICRTASVVQPHTHTLVALPVPLVHHPSVGPCVRPLALADTCSLTPWQCCEGGKYSTTCLFARSLSLWSPTGSYVLSLTFLAVHSFCRSLTRSSPCLLARPLTYSDARLLVGSYVNRGYVTDNPT